jgi:hypothetical protein
MAGIIIGNIVRLRFEIPWQNGKASRTGSWTMTTPEKALKASAVPQNIEILSADSIHSLRSELNQNIERLAYEYFKQGREAHGQHLNHWLDAQTAIMGKDVEVRESGVWYHFHCKLMGFNAEQGHVRVAMDSSEILVNVHWGKDSHGSSESTLAPIFFWGKWPLEVDPSTAAAYIKDEKLTVEAKKTDPPAANETVEVPCSPQPANPI